MMTTDPFPATHVKRADEGTPQLATRIVCCECGDVDTMTMANSQILPIRTQAKKYHARGWHIGTTRRRDLCPTCNDMNKRKENKDMARKGTPVEQAGTASDTTPLSGRMIAELYMVLDDAYDAKTQTYTRGLTDASIAEQVGVPVSVVVERRMKDFGPLRDGRAGQIVNGLAAISTNLDELIERTEAQLASLKTMRNHFASTCSIAVELAGGVRG